MLKNWYRLGVGLTTLFVFGLGSPSAFADWNTVEGFETTNPDTYLTTFYTEVGTEPTGDSLTLAAAHDGAFGLQGQLDPNHPPYSARWIYRNDATVHVQQGDVISVWMKSSGTAGGRAYFGFGAHPAAIGRNKKVKVRAGCYALSMGQNTGTFHIQMSWDFGQFQNLAQVPQTWEADHWYRMEVSWGIGGAIVGRLYDSDGVTLLNTVSAIETTWSSGGIAFRHHEDIVGTSYEFDTVQVLAGGALASQTPNGISSGLAAVSATRDVGLVAATRLTSLPAMGQAIALSKAAAVAPRLTVFPAAAITLTQSTSPGLGLRSDRRLEPARRALTHRGIAEDRRSGVST